MTEFLHDVVRKQNLDNYLQSNSINNDWDTFVPIPADPWADISLTEIASDWFNARNAEESEIRNNANI